MNEPAFFPGEPVLIKNGAVGWIPGEIIRYLGMHNYPLILAITIGVDSAKSYLVDMESEQGPQIIPESWIKKRPGDDAGSLDELSNKIGWKPKEVQPTEKPNSRKLTKV